LLQFCFKVSFKFNLRRYKKAGALCPVGDLFNYAPPASAHAPRVAGTPLGHVEDGVLVGAIVEEWEEGVAEGAEGAGDEEDGGASGEGQAEEASVGGEGGGGGGGGGAEGGGSGSGPGDGGWFSGPGESGDGAWDEAAGEYRFYARRAYKVGMHSFNSGLTALWLQRLKLMYDRPLSNVVFNVKLRRCHWAGEQLMLCYGQGLKLVHFSAQLEPCVTQTKRPTHPKHPKHPLILPNAP